MHDACIPDLILELAELERVRWPELRAVARLEGPVNDGDDGGDGGGGEGAGAGGGQGGGQGGGGGGDGGQGGQGAGGDNWTPPTREEYEAIVRDRDAAQQAAATANRTQRNNQRQQQRDAGQFEELYNDANTRVERITGLVGQQAIRGEVTAAARRLGFRNPDLAHRLIDLNGIEASVDVDAALERNDLSATLASGAGTLIEQRLKKVAEQDDYLIATPRQRQLPGAGQGGGEGGGDGGNESMNAMIRRAAGRG